MKIDSDTSLFCLIGNPVSKSLSPLIHNISFEWNKINSTYLTFNVEDLEKSIDGIKALGIKGFNVTIPYKEKIMIYLDEIDKLAKDIGAVNTVKNIDGKLVGYNTDGLGFIKSLEERNINLNNKNVLILGAGGASRAIAMTLANEGIHKLHITNRTIKRAKNLVSDINNTYENLDVKFIEKNNIVDCYDIVINTTSIGMFPNIIDMPIDPSIFDDDTIIYDIIYKPRPTKFLKESKKQNKITIDGLDMLIHQALLSENIWLSENLDYFLMKNNIKKRIMKNNIEINTNK
ncbi:shikimate dehydrogenase [Clostridium sp. D2Q-11]|uniref:Shikimate dehydrogenase (NADP(+)) n=1 Tax=Anaeromonas frigoriresistens TaxID=2683708 RepID=A0A942V185_9FIRM|nr:shikimate dehydrogenase [Anaeromonas frigoriresistens]MBS4540016.1 shikimate dehydrogenase [Anaeromonas frigoriresistens]